MLTDTSTVSVKSHTKKSANYLKFLTLLLLLYLLLYEYVLSNWAYKINHIFFLTVFFLKFFIPIILFVLNPVYSYSLLKNKFIFLYIFWFSGFLLFLALPTLISGDFFQLLKIIPKVFFFIILLNLFFLYPKLIDYFIKSFIVILTFSFFLYLLMYLTQGYKSPLIVAGLSFGFPGYYINNITATNWFSIFDFPFIRLTAFFKEPSNASAAYFSSFFLAKYLYQKNSSTSLWRIISYVMFFAGVACMSNAGFFALGLAFFIITLINNKKLSYSKLLKKIFIIMVSLFILSFALFGRYYFSSDTELIKSYGWLVGIRNVSEFYDPSGGRIDIMNNILFSIYENPLGFGLINFTGEENLYNSASAPFFWLYYGGVFTLFALLMRELQVLRAFMKYNHIEKIKPLFQAYLVIIGQGLLYGSWMNPLYFIITVIFLVSAIKTSNNYKNLGRNLKY